MSSSGLIFSNLNLGSSRFGNGANETPILACILWRYNNAICSATCAINIGCIAFAPGFPASDGSERNCKWTAIWDSWSCSGKALIGTELPG